MKTKTSFFPFALIIGTLLLRDVCHADPVDHGNPNAPASAPAQVSHPAQNPHNFSDMPPAGGRVVKNVPANVPVVGQPRVSVKPMPGGVHNPVTRPSVIQPAGPLLTQAPDHGSTQAIIGGSATPKIKTATTAAVTGTGLNHKP